MFGLSRGKITFIAIASLIVFMGVSLRRDLALTGGWSKKLPPMMVERLEFNRRINNRQWHVKAENAESEKETIRASSIDIEVTDVDTARSANVSAARGVFDLDVDKMWLYEIAGIVYLSSGSIDITAPRADYDMSEDMWYFGDGVSASDDKIHVTGRVARVDSSGVVSLGKGVRASWQLE